MSSRRLLPFPCCHKRAYSDVGFPRPPPSRRLPIAVIKNSAFRLDPRFHGVRALRIRNARSA